MSQNSAVNVIDPIGGGTSANISQASSNLTQQALQVQSIAAQRGMQSQHLAAQQALQAKQQAFEQKMLEERNKLALEHQSIRTQMESQLARNQQEALLLKEADDRESAKTASAAVLEQARKINEHDTALSQAEAANTLLAAKQTGWLKDAQEHANTYAIGREAQMNSIAEASSKWASRSRGALPTSPDYQKATGDVGFWDFVGGMVGSLPGADAALPALGAGALGRAPAALGRGVAKASDRAGGAIEAGLDFDPNALQTRLRDTMFDEFVKNVGGPVPQDQKAGIAKVFKVAMDNMTPARSLTADGIQSVKDEIAKNNVDPLTLAMLTRGAVNGFGSIVENVNASGKSESPNERSVNDAILNAVKALQQTADNIQTVNGVHPESYFQSLKTTIPGMIDKLMTRGPEVWDSISKDMPPGDLSYLTGLRNEYLDAQGQKEENEAAMVKARSGKSDAEIAKSMALLERAPAPMTAQERVRKAMDTQFPGTRSALDPTAFTKPGGLPPLVPKKPKPGTWMKTRPQTAQPGDQTSMLDDGSSDFLPPGSDTMPPV